jgi:hypothetical protein
MDNLSSELGSDIAIAGLLSDALGGLFVAIVLILYGGGLAVTLGPVSRVIKTAAVGGRPVETFLVIA